MFVQELPKADETTSLSFLMQHYEDKVFQFEGHNYGVVKLRDGGQDPPKSVKVTLEGGVLCFNLKSQTVRVLACDTQVRPMKASVQVRPVDMRVV
jgi:hypothetical protein